MFMRMPWVAIATLLLTATGCGTKVGDVRGRITYKNKTVESGSIVFLVGSSPHYAEIEPGGSYTLKGVPAGEAKIGVSSPNPSTPTIKINKPGMPTPTPSARPVGDPRKWFALPPKYSDPITSGLTFTVQAGPNTAEFNLVDD